MGTRTTGNSELSSFDFAPGRRLGGKYEVLKRLGSGWEGEVYRLRELSTGIERAAKFFFPKRNVNNKVVRRHARKLEKLRDCSILIQYHTQDTIQVQRTPITFLVSELVEGELLSNFLARQKGKRLGPFQGVNLLYSIALGISAIHERGEYHGDLHTDNIMVRRYGLGFDLKIIDMFHWGASKKENMQHDLVDLIKVFYEAMGGAKHYAKQPKQVKTICLGLKRSLIVKKFRNTKGLCRHLEEMSWT